MSNIPFEVAKINFLAGKSITGNRGLLLEQCRIVQSELTETIAALAEGNFTEFRDGVSDVEFTSLGLFALSPFSFDVDMKVVCDSNMEKFDLSEEDAEKTKLKYAAIGVETYYDVNSDLGVTYYITKSLKDQHDCAGKEYPAKKWLKSYKWKEPAYPSLVDTVDGDITYVEEIESEFLQPLSEDTLQEYSAQVAISKLISKQGAKAVFDVLNSIGSASAKEDRPVLMSVDNPTGWKLEELLEQVRVELESKNIALKNKLYNLPAGEVGQTKDIVMQCAERNNSDILELLTRAIVLQKNNMEQFDRLGADQGSTGKPRL